MLTKKQLITRDKEKQNIQDKEKFKKEITKIEQDILYAIKNNKRKIEVVYYINWATEVFCQSIINELNKARYKTTYKIETRPSIDEGGCSDNEYHVITVKI